MITEAMVARKRKKLLAAYYKKRGWPTPKGFAPWTPKFGDVALAMAQRVWRHAYGELKFQWTPAFSAYLEKDRLRARERAVKINEGEAKLGVKEVTKNRSPRIDQYKREVNGYTDAAPWCADLHAWCFLKAGDEVQIANPRYCPNYLQAALNHTDRWVRIYKNVKRGDTVLFDWDNDGIADHIGFVTVSFLGLVRVVAGPVATVEGNTGADPSDPSGHGFGDGVYKRWRKQSDVLAYLRRLDRGEVVGS